MRKVKTMAVDYAGSIAEENLITISPELGIIYDTAKEQVIVCRREDTIVVGIPGELEAVADNKYPSLPPHMRLGQLLEDANHVSKMATLQDKIEELKNGLAEMKNGIEEMNDGIAEMHALESASWDTHAQTWQ